MPGELLFRNPARRRGFGVDGWRVVHARDPVSTCLRYMLRFYSGMPTLLTCPEIARRTGYSRMQITRLAGLDQIPGGRTITKGGQLRYELTPALAEWIRVMRRRPTKVTRLDSGCFILNLSLVSSKLVFHPIFIFL